MPSRIRHSAVTALRYAVASAYVLVFLVNPRWMPIDEIRGYLVTFRGQLDKFVKEGVLQPAGFAITSLSVHGIYLALVAGLVPLIATLVLCKGSLKAAGLRKPNVYGWRILLVGYLLSWPFQIWMVQSPQMAKVYLAQLNAAGTWGFLAYYAVNITTEHFLLQGALLAWLRPRSRWPDAVAIPVAGGNPLRWLGLGMPPTPNRDRVTTWLGLPTGCVAPILCSAALFAAVHIGKDVRELVLSAPGGVALAYIAYRTNSWLTALLLHASTAGTALLLMMATAKT